MKKKRNKIQISETTKQRILRFVDSVASMIVLILTIQFSTSQYTDYISGGLLFLTIGGSLAIRSGIYLKNGRKLNGIVGFAFAALITGCAVYIFAARMDTASVVFACVSYIVYNISSRVLFMMKNHKPYSITVNVIIIVLLLFFIFMVITSVYADMLPMCVMLVCVLIGAQALFHIIYISFSQIKLGVLLKILRKTFAFEIMSGLVLMILSFSFVFKSVEESIKTYEDALWYSFALVTTIGFGDMYAETVVGRVLSIILGIYGIIVVALITSIIVNFYNEVRDEKKEKVSEKGETENEETEEVKEEKSENK